MRLLLLTLLVSLGLVAATARPHPQSLARQGVEGVWQQRGAEAFHERAPLVPPPVRMAARSGHDSPPSRVTDGAGAVLGEGQYSSTMPRHVAVRPSTDAPCIGERDRRRQPEGRGPPRRPTAA